MSTFGNFVREKRLALGLSLREFAKKIGLQPSNYCNIENDGLKPPKADVLDKMLKVLSIEKGTEEYAKFYDLAGKSRKEVAQDLAEIIKTSEMIPALLRTAEGENVSDDQLRWIIDEIKAGKYKHAKKNRTRL